MLASPLRGPGFPPLATRSVAGYGDCPSGTAAIPDAGRSPATGTPGPEYRAVHAGSRIGELMAVASLRTWFVFARIAPIGTWGGDAANDG